MMLTIAHFQGHHVDLLRTMMMTVLEMRVTAAKMGISTPNVGIIIIFIIISIISSSSASSHHHQHQLIIKMKIFWIFIQWSPIRGKTR